MSTLFDLPEWASSPTDPNAIATPNAAVRAQGWLLRAIPPRNWTNWLARRTYDWLANLSAGAAVYATLDEFVASAEAGDTGIVRGGSNDGETEPLGEVATINASGDVASVDADAEYIVVAANNAGTKTVTLRERDGTSVRTYTLSSSPTTLTRAITNGAYVAVIYDQIVELFDRDTAVSQWTYDHGAGLTDVAMDSARVYIVGGTGTGSFQARAIGIADGVADWSYDHGAVLNAVCCDGVRTYVGGNAGTGSEHVAALNSDTATPEWTAVLSSAVAIGQSMATDGAELWVKAHTEIYRYGARYGAQMEELGSVSSSDTSVLCLTPRYALIRFANATMYIDRRHAAATLGGTIGSFAVAVVVGAPTTSIACDGDRIYVGSAVTSSASLRIVQMPQIADRLYKRTQAGWRIQPMRQLAYPVE